MSSKEFIWSMSSVTIVVLTMCGISYWISSGPECRVEVDAGELLAHPGEDAIGTFSIHNDGQSVLDYSVTRTCQCTKLSSTSGSVRPGQSESVRVSISPLKEIDAIRPVSIEVLTNDPDQASHRVDFTIGKIMPWVFANPTASFGVLTQRNYYGQVRTLDLVAATDLDAPVPIPQLTVVGGSRFITGKVVSTGAKSWRIEFGLQPDIPVGQYTTTFAVGTPEHLEIAHIPVFLRVAENVVIRPVMTMLSTSESQPITVEVHGVDCEVPASEIRVPEVPGVSLIGKEQLSPSRVRVTLDLSHEYRTSLPQKVRIIANGLGQSELLCVKSGISSKKIRQVVHPGMEESKP